MAKKDEIRHENNSMTWTGFQIDTLKMALSANQINAGRILANPRASS